jgi:hypothetical protein
MGFRSSRQIVGGDESGWDFFVRRCI